ncbi:Histone transcription regulator 3-like protein [Bienertia sinuspersici]
MYKYHSLSPLAAEIQALRDSLLPAKQFQLTKVEVETNVKSILLLLDDAQNNPKHDLKALIIDVANLLKLEWQITLSHVNREAIRLLIVWLTMPT